MLQQNTLLVHLINSKFNTTTNHWGVGYHKKGLAHEHCHSVFVVTPLPLRKHLSDAVLPVFKL